MKQKFLLSLLLGLLGSCGLAQASILYTFSFSPGTAFSTTSFSITAPDYFNTQGTQVPIQPFTITKGTSSWTMDKAYVSPLCIVFATSNGSVGSSGNPAFCTAGAGLHDSGWINTDFDFGGSPTQQHPGTLTGTIQIKTFNSNVVETDYSGPVTLTITALPEPATLGLTGSAFVLWGLLARRRRRRP